MSAGYVHIRVHGNLHLCSLTAAQREKTCSYWYTVTSHGCTPHTAFRTRAALARWLEMHGLSLPREIPVEGEHDHMPVSGAYGEAMHATPETFFAEKGTTTRRLSNGSWTLGILNKDAEGRTVIHCLNPNAQRPVFDWRESQRLEDEGGL